MKNSSADTHDKVEVEKGSKGKESRLIKDEPGSNLQYGLDAIIANKWNTDTPPQLRNFTFQKKEIKTCFVYHYKKKLANREEIHQ